MSAPAGGVDVPEDIPPTVPEAIAEAELATAPADRPRARASSGPAGTALLVVGVGGVLGANARYFLGLWAAARWGAAFPWATLVINVTGSFVLGFYLTLVTERFAGRPTTRLFLATGFLGAYTTFSTFGYETVSLILRGEPVGAAAYVTVTLVAGLAAVVLGIVAAHAL